MKVPSVFVRSLFLGLYFLVGMLSLGYWAGVSTLASPTDVWNMVAFVVVLTLYLFLFLKIFDWFMGKTKPVTKNNRAALQTWLKDRGYSPCDYKFSRVCLVRKEKNLVSNDFNPWVDKVIANEITVTTPTGEEKYPLDWDNCEIVLEKFKVVYLGSYLIVYEINNPTNYTFFKK